MGIQPGQPCSRSASAQASTCRSIRAVRGHRHRLLVVDAREGSRARAANGRCAISGSCRWTQPTSSSPTNAFDIVYAPLPDQRRPGSGEGRLRDAARCRPGGRIIFLNHFLSPNPLVSRVERLISPFTIHIGFKADLDLPAFLAQADLQPVSIEKVNVPRIWSLVTCVKD